jgi:type I restriction-modification system DNA methylase subunit
MKKELGIYTTPRQIIDFCIKILKPEAGQLILDPACGTGGFLKGIIDYFNHENLKISQNKIFGIDIDSNAYISMEQYQYKEYIHLINSDSLQSFGNLRDENPNLNANNFDIVLTSPPFGRINSNNPRIMRDKYLEVSFLKRCLKFLKPNGKMAILLPDSILRSSKHSKIIDYILEKSKILAIVSIPQFGFVHYGSKIKTSILFLEKKDPEMKELSNYNLFMAIPKQIGVDAKGRPEKNDFNLIIEEYDAFYKDPDNYIGFNPDDSNVKFFAINTNNIKDRLNAEFHDPFSVWKSAINFERYVLSLIEAYAKRENKVFYPNYKVKNNKLYGFDGFAPNGLWDFEGPLIIEVKYKLHSKSQIDKIINNLDHIDEEIANILIITDFLDKKRFLKDKFIEENINITFWNQKDLKKLEEEIPEVSYPLTKDLGGAIKFWLNANYDYQRDSLIDEIGSKDNLVLFLGAGCSVGDEIPNWNKLLENLLFDLFNEHIEDEDLLNRLELINKDDKFFKIKEKLDKSNLMLGRFIKEMLDERFTEQTRMSLYNNDIRDICGNSTLNAISDFIRDNKDSINGIITYNFDDLLEFYLDKRHINYNSIYNGGINPSQDQIPIYHVHGYLPKDIVVENDSVIFGEKEYHIQYGDPHSWQNMIPLKFLREKTVLFIGLSMDDPNLRRLLEIGYRYFNSPKHYLIYSKKRWDSHDENVSNIFRGMEERTFHDLGLKIIWLENHDEIIDLLKNISKSRS